MQKHNYKIKEFHANTSDEEFNRVIRELKNIKFGQVNSMYAATLLKAIRSFCSLCALRYTMQHMVQIRLGLLHANFVSDS